MTEKQPAGARPKEDHAQEALPEEARAQAPWLEPKVSALLVLADGTVFEGSGFGATGRAVGAVCFNTAMTGYQEILTDPSYAAQLSAFTIPHIANVGTDDADIETFSPSASAAAPGAMFRMVPTLWSNWCATDVIFDWLRKRNVIALAAL